MNQHQLVKTFIEFVKIDSPTGHEMDFSNYLKKRIQLLGYRVFQDRRGNLLVRVKGEGDPILLSGHIDTVEPGRGIAPVVGRSAIRSPGDTILGADNKAMIACMVDLLERVKDFVAPVRAFEMLFSVGEESGVSGIETFDMSKIHSKQGICVDASQPFGTILCSSPYYVSQKIELQGIAADSSKPHLGKDVLSALSRFIASMPHGVMHRGEVLSNFGVVAGGTGSNSLLSHVVLKGEIRSFSKQLLDALVVKYQTLLKQTRKRCGIQARYDTLIENHGYTLSKSSPVVLRVRNALKQTKRVSNVQYLKRYWGVSDANNLNHRGVQTVNLGYEVSGTHTVKEALPISSLVDISTLLSSVVGIRF